MQHVAIMRRSWGLTERIASGQKTIESRWSNRRVAPWDRIRAGETVYFKDSGQPIRLRATVAAVDQFKDLTPTKVRALLERYGAAGGLIAAELPTYYERFKTKRYAIFIFLRDVCLVEPFHITKRGFGAQSAWLAVDSIDRLRV